MTEHQQYITVRNEKGREMLDLIKERLVVTEPQSTGDRRAFVMQTLQSDDAGKRGEAREPLPRWFGTILAWLLSRTGPKGIEFAKYSIDYHYLRNYLYIHRHWKKDKAHAHLPQYAKQIVSEYEPEVSKMIQGTSARD